MGTPRFPGRMALPLHLGPRCRSGVGPGRCWASSSASTADPTGRYRSAQADRAASPAAPRSSRCGWRPCRSGTSSRWSARGPAHYDADLLLLEGTTIELTGERSWCGAWAGLPPKDTFTVRYGSVETVVGDPLRGLGRDSGGEQVRVRVDEAGSGSSRARSGGGAVGLRRRLPAAGPERAPPPPPPAPAWSTGGLAGLLRRSSAWDLQVLATGSGGSLGDGTPSIDAFAARGARISAGVGLGRYLRLTTATAVGLNGAQRLRLPQELSLGVALPKLPLAFGGGPELTYERCTKTCGGRYQALHLGGTGWVQGTLSIGPRFAILGEARASVGDVVRASGGLGVEVAL